MPTQGTSAPTPVQDDERRPLVRRGVVCAGYWVTADGSILSQWEKVGAGRIRWEIGEQLQPLAAYPIGKNGAYLGVAFRHAGRTIRASVHTLVMEAFVGPCPAGLEVCHGDGNGHNNRLSNLRYDTKPANHADKRKHGTHQDGQRNPSAKLSDDEAERLRRLRAGGMKLREVAALFGVRESTASRIANGVRRAR